MKKQFPLFQSHLDLAHQYWSQLVQPGNTVIDATCGNGSDTLKLCQLTLSSDKGKVYSFDIQQEAIDSSLKLIRSHITPEIQKNIEFQLRCHSTFPPEIRPATVRLIVYNLGYLPGGDKALTTRRSTTLQSLTQAIPLIQYGGAISITCYPGHEEGLLEQKEIIDFASLLSPKEWSCCHHIWLNRKLSPSLLLIQKSKQLENLAFDIFDSP